MALTSVPEDRMPPDLLRGQALMDSVNRSCLRSDVSEDALLQDCPSCGYCVRGLPVEHKCPECGFEVDRRWQVFGGRALQAGVRTGRIHAPWRWFLLVPVFYASSLVVSVFLSPPRQPPVVAILPVLLAVVLAAWWLRQLRPKAFIAIGPTALIVFRRNQPTPYAWQHIGRAQYALMHKSIEFNYDGDNVRIPVQPIFSFAIGEVDRCVQAINAHPRAGAGAMDTRSSAQSSR
jgi:hypothetical protein